MSAYINFPTPTQLKNLQDPTANTDAVTKQYVDISIANVANADFALVNDYFVHKTGDTVTGIINIANTQNSGSNTTGALIVAGGVGITGDLYSTAIHSNNYFGIIDAGTF